MLKIGDTPLHVNFHGIIQQCWLQSYVPMDWRGGRLVALHKKGSTLETDNYCGLLVSDQFSKATTKLLAPRATSKVEQALPHEQCGGVSGKGTDFATHVIRTAVDYAKVHTKSMAVLYIDLTKAFDRIIREFAVGWPKLSSVDKQELLCSLGLEKERRDEVIAMLDEEGCTLGKAEGTQHR